MTDMAPPNSPQSHDAATAPRMTLSDAQQMCAAPSDAFSAGEWCEAACVLLQALYDNVRAEDWPE